MTPLLDSIGPFQVLGELGSGGMGAVFLARDPALSRLVAVKVIHSGQWSSSDARRRFQLEAEAAASLEHPHIVPVYRVDDSSSGPFIAMKYLPGGSLGDRLQEGPLSLSDSALLLSRVARAVEHAHHRGFLHRDIKPSNILLDESGVPHLGDFGLAKRIDSDVGATQTHVPLGTCGYMAPEVAQHGATAATQAADVYSLGAVLYALLSGRPPYQATSFADFVRQIATHDPPPPRQSRATHATPPPRDTDPRAARRSDLELICLRCLERDPNRRYATAGALADDLDAWLDGRPLAVRPPRPDERIGAWIRRHRILATSALGIVMSLFLGLAATFWQWRQAASAVDKLSRANVRLTLERFERETAPGRRQEGLRELIKLCRDHPDHPWLKTRLWSAMLHRIHPLRALPALSHPGEVQEIQFLQDPRFLLARVSGTVPAIHLWNLTDGTRIGTVPHVSENIGVQTDQERRRLLVHAPDGRPRLYAIPELHEIPGPWTNTATPGVLTLSPDGTGIATAEGRNVVMWSVDAPVRTWTRALDDPPHLLVFSANGTELLAAGEAGIGWRLSTQTGQVLESIEPRFGPILAAHASPRNEGFLLVGKQTLSIAPPSRGKPERFRVQLGDPVQGACFSPGGGEILVWTDVRIREYSLNTGRTTRRTANLSDSLIQRVRYAENGYEIIACTQSGMASIFTGSKGLTVREGISVDGAALDARFSPDYRQVAVATAGGEIHVFQIELRLHGDGWEEIAVSNVVTWAVDPHGRSLFTLDSSHTLAALSLDATARTEATTPLEWVPTGFTFSGLGHTMLAWDNAGVFGTLDPARFGPFKQIGTLDPPVTSTPLVDDSGRIVAYESRSQVVLAQLTTNRIEGLHRLPAARAGSLRLSSDGRFTAFRDPRGHPRLYRTENGAEIALADSRPQPVARTGSADLWLSPDGQWLAAHRDMYQIQIWSTDSAGATVANVHLGTLPVDLAFRRDATAFGVSGANRLIRQWRLPGPRLLPDTVRGNADLGSLEFTSDGRFLATQAGRLLELRDSETGATVIDPRQYEYRPSFRLTRDGHKRLVTSIISPIHHRLRIQRLPTLDTPPTRPLLALAQLALDADFDPSGQTRPWTAEGLRQVWTEAQTCWTTPSPKRYRHVSLYVHQASDRAPVNPPEATKPLGDAKDSSGEEP